jgi:hypothetical protein
MRVQVGEELRYDDLRVGNKELPAGKYVITPLSVGVEASGMETVAYKLQHKKRQDVYRLDAGTFEAWKKDGKIKEL